VGIWCREGVNIVMQLHRSKTSEIRFIAYIHCTVCKCIRVLSARMNRYYFTCEYKLTDMTHCYCVGMFVYRSIQWTMHDK